MTAAVSGSCRCPPSAAPHTVLKAEDSRDKGAAAGSCDVPQSSCCCSCPIRGADILIVSLFERLP